MSHLPTYFRFSSRTLWIIPVLVVIFFGNLHHTAEQGIYQGWYVPIAQQLIHHGQYGFSTAVDAVLFFPLWGYTFLVALTQLTPWPNTVLLLIQAGLALATLELLYRIDRCVFRWWHVILWVPLVAVMSVKWSHALSMFFIVLAVYALSRYIGSLKLRWIIVAGIVFGALVNIRSEFFLTLIVCVILGVVSQLKKQRGRALRVWLGVLGISLLMLMPWAVRSWHLTHKFLLTSANGGGVLYITLGQLPNNPWGIKHDDGDAYRYVNSRGFHNPYEPQADALLRSAFFESIHRYPLAFVNKMLFNVWSAMKGGLFIGEYQGWAITPERGIALVEIQSRLGIHGALQNMSAPEILLEGITFGLRVMFQLVLFGIWLAVAWMVISRFHFMRTDALSVVYVSIIVSFILSVAVAQYQTRHLNLAYPFLLLLLYRGLQYRSQTVNAE